MEISNPIISNDEFEKYNIKNIPTDPNETPIHNKHLDLNLKNSETSQSKNQKNIKFDNNISIIPLKQTYNLRYGPETNTYNNLNDNIKDIINDPKYNSEQRNKSSYSKKSFREKFESMKLKVPEIKKWNCDPTAEIIIHNLEQKIDILEYENFLLTKQIKELVSNNKSLQLDLNQKILLLRTEQQINDENLKRSQNLDNLEQKNNIKKFKGNNVDLLKEISLLKEENIKLKKSNENLAQNNMELNKIISELKNEIKLNQNNFDEEFEKIKKLYENKLLEQNENNELLLEQKLSEQNEKNKELNNNNEDSNDNINNSFNDEQKSDDNSNSTFNMNKYLQNEEEYKKLIEENERLHKELRKLLSIDDEEDINKYSSSFQDNNQNFVFSPIKDINNDNRNIKLSEIKKNLNITEKNSINNINNNKNENIIQSENIIKENNLLKQKIKSLSSELDKVTHEHNRKLLEIQEKFKEYESKNRTILTKDNTNNEINDNENDKEKELDRILNETLLMYINDEDEDSKKMILTLKNIKNNQKKRISQCLIINNKLKSLNDENILLHNKLLSMEKNNNLMNVNHNLFKSLNLNNYNNPHLCYCGRNHESYDYLINALKIKDQIIIKYKEQSENNENKYNELIIENSKLKEIYQNNDNRNYKNKKNNIYYNNVSDNINHHYRKKDNRFNTMKNERANGLEDYLLGKLVNNQREILEERAPIFDENNYEYMSKSMQYEPNIMNNKYNNYHYREKRMTNY